MILDKKFESAEFEELRKKSVSAVSGIFESDAVLLKRAFGIDTVQELAERARASNSFMCVKEKCCYGCARECLYKFRQVGSIIKYLKCSSVSVENIQQKVGSLLHKQLKIETTENNKTMPRDKIEDYLNIHAFNE